MTGSRGVRRPCSTPAWSRRLAGCWTAGCATGDRRPRAGLRAGDRGAGRRRGDAELDRARELTFVGTRRYVRRQRSWFRRDHRIRWLDAASGGLAEAVLTHWRHVF